tara:strand:- start:54 stop:581 length:528 start_codon:yes stop_codon:yes gene_type:complete
MVAMIRYILLGIISVVGAGNLWGASAMDGTWKIEPELGTDLGSWRTLEIDIETNGDLVTINRRFAAGRRKDQDSMTIDLTKDKNIVPVRWWPDNRYIGAFISDAHEKTVRGKWMSDGRVLRLESDLVLTTQQGDVPVNILRNYKVSANGKQLSLITIRSTRDRPVVYFFKRAESK